MNTTENQPAENSILDKDSLAQNSLPRKESFFRHHGHKIAIGAILLIFVGIPLLLAALEYQQKIKLEPTVFYLLEQVAKYSLMTAGIFWFFFFGGALGSFLNVVAWRLPQGRTLWGSSYCPGCDTKLKLQDNFPLFGWLWRKGRCRTCQMEIAGRYFIVELIASVTIGILALVELIGAGANLQSTPDQITFSFERFAAAPEPRFIGYFLLHSSLIFILITAALITLQKQALPKSILVFGFCIYIITSVAWTQALPFTENHLEITDTNASFASIRPMCCGLIVSLVGGLILTRLLPGKRLKGKWDFTLLLMLVGAVLGWQAAVVTIALTTLFTLVGRLIYSKCTPTEVLWLATSITIYTLRIWIEQWQNGPLDGRS